MGGVNRRPEWLGRRGQRRMAEATAEAMAAAMAAGNVRRRWQRRRQRRQWRRGQRRSSEPARGDSPATDPDIPRWRRRQRWRCAHGGGGVAVASGNDSSNGSEDAIGDGNDGGSFGDGGDGTRQTHARHRPRFRRPMARQAALLLLRRRRWRGAHGGGSEQQWQQLSTAAATATMRRRRGKGQPPLPRPSQRTSLWNLMGTDCPAVGDASVGRPW